MLLGFHNLLNYMHKLESNPRYIPVALSGFGDLYHFTPPHGIGNCAVKKLTLIIVPQAAKQVRTPTI